MNPGFLWQSALERIRQRVTPSAYTTWFRDTSGITLEGRRLTVGVANAFACEHLGRRFADLARVALSEALGAPAQIAFVVSAAPTGRPTGAASGRPQSSQDASPASSAADAALFARPSAAPARRRATGTPHGQGAQIAHYGVATHAPHTAPTPPPPMPPATWDHPPAASTTAHAPFGVGEHAFVQARRVVSQWMAQPPLLKLDSAHAAPFDVQGQQQAPDQVAPTQAPMRGSEGPRRAPTTPRLLVTPEPAPTAFAEPPSAQHDLRPGYRFETFVVGMANRLAFAAAQEVTRAPGTQYNPLLIYGAAGLGKTHLLHAIGHQANTNGLRTVYVTAEQFTTELVEAIHQRATEKFRRRYRAVDVLLLDDAQWIAGREATEEEFFHTFNWLHEANKQIVLASDCAPQAMRRLHDRLRSRCAWGLIADIQAPDMGARLDILRAKAQAQAITITDEALACLARPTCANVRELEGKLTRVVAYARLLERPLDAALVAQALAPLGAASSASVGGEAAPSPQSRTVDAMMALSAVSRHYGVSMVALLGKSREHQVAWARQVAMHVLRETTSASLFQIGAQLGGRDHTTIMHGCARVSQALASDPLLRADLAAIHAALQAL